MTALAAERSVSSKGDTKFRRVLMADSTTIFAGGMVMLNSAGLATPGANTASAKGCVGVATETVTSGTGGDDWVLLEYGFSYQFAASSVTQAIVGSLVFIVDDQTVDETVSNSIIAGVVEEFISTTSVRISIGNEYLT